MNVEFVKVNRPDDLTMRVWERGAGETLACGTGACAAVAAALRNGKVQDGPVTVKLRGGELTIEWDREKNEIFLTGPAEVSFDGELHLA